MQTKEISSIVNKFFEKTSKSIAIITKFVQRKSKMTGEVYLKTLVLGFLENPQASLLELADFCSYNLDIEITKQGLDERINNYAVDFLKEMFAKAILSFRNASCINLPLLNQFSQVNIFDSTAFSLPDSLVGDFLGNGGTASIAAVKIQLLFDFLSGNFDIIELVNGRCPDQAYKKHFDNIKPNSLNLFDLGYFSLDNLKKIDDKQAYFLTRFFTPTNLYLENGIRFFPEKYLRDETRNCFELDLSIGFKYKTSCRVAFYRVPNKVAKKRREKARKKAKKQGYIVSKTSIYLMGWTILITNVPANILNTKQIALLYSIRWQIELIFKLWKSECKIHKTSSLKRDRVLCEIYAKLIGIILYQFLFASLRLAVGELSPTKAMRIFRKKANKLAEKIHLLRELPNIVEKIQKSFLKYAKRDKRKNKKHNNRVTSCQRILLNVDIYSLT